MIPCELSLNSVPVVISPWARMPIITKKKKKKPRERIRKAKNLLSCCSGKDYLIKMWLPGPDKWQLDLFLCVFILKGLVIQ